MILKSKIVTQQHKSINECYFMLLLCYLCVLFDQKTTTFSDPDVARSVLTATSSSKKSTLILKNMINDRCMLQACCYKMMNESCYFNVFLFIYFYYLLL